MFRGAEPLNPNRIAHRVAANPARNITGRIADDMKDEISEKNFLLSFVFVDGGTTFILKGSLPNRNLLNAENRSRGLRQLGSVEFTVFCSSCRNMRLARIILISPALIRNRRRPSGPEWILVVWIWTETLK